MKWYCQLSESYHDTEEEAKEICREFIEEQDYLEHVYEIDASQLFKALTNPQVAEEVFYQIINETEQCFFEDYVFAVDEEDDEEEEENENI